MNEETKRKKPSLVSQVASSPEVLSASRILLKRPSKDLRFQISRQPEDPVLFPLTTVALTLLASTVIGTFAQAQDDSGQFTIGNAGQAPNQDSDLVPGLTMQTPSYSGTGCPGGTASTTLSSDGKTLSVLFDSYIAEAGSHRGQTRDAKGCQINIPFMVPPGFAVQVVKMDYRGFTAIPAGGRSTFGAGFRILEINGRATNTRRVLRANVMLGPKNEEFMLSSVLKGPQFSPCGQNFILAAESTLNVQSNTRGEQTLSTVDSLDAVQTPVIYSLRWKKCGGGHPGGPGHGGTVRPGHGGVIVQPVPPGRPVRPMPPGRPIRPQPPRFR